MESTIERVRVFFNKEITTEWVERHEKFSVELI